VTEAHTARAHAKLAPSSAHRWVECPGSVQLSEGIPNTSSVFAAEGTAAHELCAHCLETGDDPATFLDMWIDIHAPDGKGRFVNLDEPPSATDEFRYFVVDDEMVDGVAMYVDHVKSLMPHSDCLLSVEQKLDMTHIDPRIFGTGDATVLDMQSQHLHVIDFKYGKGVSVDADRNPQLMLYAAGAVRRHHNHSVAKLTVHVVQPRAYHLAGPIRQFDLDLIELMEFEFEIEAAAARTNLKDPPLKAGEWCHFCPAQGLCPARREQIYQDAAIEFTDLDINIQEIEAMTPEQRGQILRNADSIFNYVKAVQKFEHDRALAGDMPAGFKLVAKRATRKWRDEEEAKEVLAILGVAPDALYEEPKFKTPAKLESFFPGKNKTERQNAMADLVKKESSGLNLVANEDPRPAVVVEAASEFDAVDVG